MASEGDLSQMYIPWFVPQLYDIMQIKDKY